MRLKDTESDNRSGVNVASGVCSGGTSVRCVRKKRPICMGGSGIPAICSLVKARTSAECCLMSTKDT